MTHPTPDPAPPQNYADFLQNKHFRHIPSGFPTHPDDLPLTLAPFQRAITALSLSRGRSAIFASTGTGKTRMQLAWADEVARLTGGRVLVLTPLAVAEQTVAEGRIINIPVHHTRAGDDLRPGINITNYEMLRHFNPADFVGVVLDESSIIKHHDAKSRTFIIDTFRDTPYKLACTATPSPNDHTELGNHAEFLGVMTRAEMLATYFVHDGGDTSEWRLKGHAVQEFWAWVSSWAVGIRKPSDLGAGFSDEGYDLPPLNIHFHCLDAQHDGQDTLFPMPARGLTGQRQAKRDSLADRVRHAADLVAQEPGEQWLVWCELNDEGNQLTRSIPGAVQVKGADRPEHKTQALLGFARGEVPVLVTKSSIAGFGMNWQGCAHMIFTSVTNSWESFYQAVRRCYRYGQTRPVEVHVIFGEKERAVVENLLAKEREAVVMSEAMVRHLTFELSHRRTVRDLEGYHPTQAMQLPAWLRGEGEAA